MADFPSPGVCLPVYSVFSSVASGGALNLLANSAGNGASTAWPSANRAIYVPFYLPASFTLASMFSYNGATATGNIDLGVYGVDGTLIASKGATAQSGTSTLQILTMASLILLPPGRYYMAMSASSTSSTVFARTPNVATQQRMGILQAASQNPLATGPTLATVASSFLPFFGIAQITTY
jgi:hypothetical protein